MHDIWQNYPDRDHQDEYWQLTDAIRASCHEVYDVLNYSPEKLESEFIAYRQFLMRTLSDITATIIKCNWENPLQDITSHIHDSILFLKLNGPALFSPEADTLFESAACRLMSSKDRRLLTPKSWKNARPVKLGYRRKSREKKDVAAFCEKREYRGEPIPEKAEMKESDTYQALVYLGMKHK
eukprot:g9308.t1